MTLPIRYNTELDKFGFDGSRFRRIGHDKQGGSEWAGPCPVCGGTDRCIVSNGFYWCRHAGNNGSVGACSFKGHLENMGKTPKATPEEKAEAARRAAENEEREAKEQREKIRQINRTQVWRIYHETLLSFPELLEWLEKEGITRKEVERYQIGYTASFSTYERETQRTVTVPAYAFPHFSGSGECLNIRMRIMDPEFAEANGKYRPWKPGLPTLFFPAYDDNDKYVVFVEGEKKAIVLKSHGIPAIGLWGIYAVKDEWIPWLEKRFEKRYLVYDADNWNVILSTYTQAERLMAKPVFTAGKPDDLITSGKMTPEAFIQLLEMEPKCATT